MFRESIRRTGKKPTILISDGAHNFHEAHRKEFWYIYGEAPSPQHIKEIRLEGRVHNNKMERQNGEWRDREKVMWSLKKENSPVIEGMQIYHNFFRPHMGLEGKTPAQVAGLDLGLDGMRWKELIRKAVGQ